MLPAAFTHEWVLSRQRYVLVCRAEDFRKIHPGLLKRSIQRLAKHQGGYVRLSDLIEGNEKIFERQDGITLGLFDLDWFNFPFGIKPKALLAKIAGATPLTEPHLPRAIITDPGLKTRFGHHLGVAQDLAIGLSEAGYSVAVALNKDAVIESIDGAGFVTKSFSDFFYEQNGDVGLYRWEFQEAMRATNVLGGDLVFAHCASPAMLAAITIWLAGQPRAERPQVVIRFDRPSWRTPYSVASYEICFQRIKQFGLRRHFSFSVESSNLQRYFHECASETFPIRFNSIYSEENNLHNIIKFTESSKISEITISFVGEAREEKGFHNLPFIIEHTWERFRNARTVLFRIQVGSNTWNQTPIIQAARLRLEQLAERYPQRLQLLKGNLSDSEYGKLIEDADIVLMPYDPLAYRVRGSGVASEAAAKGKVIVVSHGCDIIRTYAEFAVVASASYSPVDISFALCDAIERLAELKERAAEGARKCSFPSNRRDFAESFLVPGPAGAGLEKSRLVLWISNDTIGEGSDCVYKSQLAFLRDQGFLPILIRVPYPARWRLGSRRAFDWNEAFVNPDFEAEFSNDPAFENTLTKFEGGLHSLKNFMEAWSYLEVPSQLMEFLRTAEFAFAVVNYAHHRPVVRQLLGREVPMVVEAHDIQAHQYAIQQNRRVQEEEVREELEALKSFDHIVSISATEAELMRAACGDTKVTWCMPFVDAPRIQLKNAWTHDVLFVGSSHEANITSLHWFMQSVYEAVLYPRGVTLKIVGTAGNTVDPNRYGGAVEITGRVAELAPHYESCGVVALPVITGAGVPIKVLDAMAHGAPFVLMDFPAAAMNLDPEIPLAFSAADMAEQILACLSDHDHRAWRASLGYRFAVARASRQSYYETWDSILKAVI
jgi:glycosyltransferase involved in cell wall biosynthesis